MLFSLLLLAFSWGIDIYPTSDSIWVESDTNEKGHSKVEFHTMKSGALWLQVELDTAFAWPYGGLSFPIAKPNCGKATSTDTLSIEWQKQPSSTVVLQFLTNIPKEHRKSLKDAYRLGSYRFLPKSSISKIPLDSFAVPTWWQNKHNIQNESPYWGEVCKLDVLFGSKGEGPHSFELKRIHIIQKKSSWQWLYWCFMILTSFFFGWKLIQNKPRSILTPSPTIVPTPNNTSDFNFVLEYLQQHYSQELSPQGLAKELNFSLRDFNPWLKAQHNMTLKSYINNLRLQEAKRLLLETEMQVTQIAFQIGFKTVNHFHKSFKDEYHCTPGSLRKK